MADQADRHRCDERSRSALIDEPEEREGKQHHEHRAAEVKRPAPGLVRPPAKQRHNDELHRGTDQHRAQHIILFVPGVGGRILQHVDRDDVKERVLRKTRAHGEQHVAWIAAQHFQDGHLGLFRRLLLRRGENRALHHMQPDEHADPEEQNADQKRHAPAPAQKRGFIEATVHQPKHRRGQQEAHRHARLHPARQKAALPCFAMLHRHQHRASPFTANTQPLDETQHDEQDRREDTCLLIRRQQPDGEGRQPHHHERGHEHRFPPDLVPVMPEDDATERPREEPDRIRAKRSHRRRKRVELCEEQLPKHQRGRRPIKEEVIPLDGGADEARQDDATGGGGGRSRSWIHERGCKHGIRAHCFIQHGDSALPSLQRDAVPVGELPSPAVRVGFEAQGDVLAFPLGQIDLHSLPAWLLMIHGH